MNRLGQGIVMIALGLALFFLVRAQGVSGGVTLALIGSGFMVAHALTGEYGYLVPGGIMVGLGMGIAWPPGWGGFHGSTPLVGLGLGLILIHLAGRRGEGGSWSLVPGTILVLVGLLTGIGDVVTFLSLWWPLAVVAAGVWVILSGQRRGGRRT